MRERLQQRLVELRKEFQEGQKAISELESKLTSVRATVLRISGAIHVLEEELMLDQKEHDECTGTG
jgi:phage-related tail protein